MSVSDGKQVEHWPMRRAGGQQLDYLRIEKINEDKMYGEPGWLISITQNGERADAFMPDRRMAEIVAFMLACKK